jgi:hypothetical protein
MMPPIGPAGRPFRLPGHTWIGLLVLAAGQFGLFRGIPLAATWLTPIMWSGYILALDGVNFGLRGQSWLTARRREFPLLVLLSVAVWLVFEGYNLHLVNWVYRGLPTRALVRDFGYFWSFATIMPGVFETADFVEALFQRAAGLRAPGRRIPGRRAATRTSSVGPAWLWWLAGIAMVSLPLALPNPAAAHTFGAVWIGFFLLLDPLNERLGLPSIRVQWAGGHRRAALALLLGGLLCGFLWETWNQQAVRAGGAYWVYTVPHALRVFGWHFGQMPVLGLLGFPPFALELFAAYQLLREMLGGSRLFGPLPTEVPAARESARSGSLTSPP